MSKKKQIGASTIPAIVEYKDFGFEHHSGEEFGSWEAQHSYHFSGYVRIRKDGTYSNGEYVTLPANVKVGDTVYFVWVSYNTGDSFGHRDNSMIDVGIYTDKDHAEEIAAAIKQNAKDFPDFEFEGEGNSLTVRGEKIYSGSWKGYFDHFNDVHVETLTVI